MTAQVVAPIALSVAGEQLAHELNVYKNSNAEGVRSMLTIRLAAVLWRWLVSHEDCLSRFVNDEFPIVTTVPSSAGRPRPHPMAVIVGGLIKPTADRFQNLLIPNVDVIQGREFSGDRWRVTQQIPGSSVLLIDDTWTTGAHIQSAASALVLAGARQVAVVTIGRHFRRQQSKEDHQQAAEAYYRSASRTPWEWETCCLERDVPP